MRIVVKVGTSTLAYATGRMNIHRTEKLCQVLSDLKNEGNEVILVSSGAIGMGIGKLGLSSGRDDMATKQASAAVGQCELMYTYDKYFSEYRHTVGKILLTKSDFEDETRHRNFHNTVTKLLDLGCLPIINENDSVATEEISVGDNDSLAALVATSVAADRLIILSDIEGLYTADPKKDPSAKIIPYVEEIDDRILSLGGESVSGLGRGGMITKLLAAKKCQENGIETVIMSGEDPDRLYRVMHGERFGTLFGGNKK
ncbi:MAG: glutamate 5-kinase [Clostridia bacterium]|nr:glutamate 5-kinase [Clostridia bacterium]